MPRNDVSKLSDRTFLKAFRVGHRVAEHVKKHGAKEVVGKLDGMLAFAADDIGLVENGSDALLFGQGWEGDFNCPNPFYR